MRLFRSAPIPQTTTIALESGPATVAVRVSARAQRYRLSVSMRGEPVLTVPATGRWRDAERFLARQAGWLEARLARRPAGTALAPGALVPLRGTPHRLRLSGRLRGTVQAETDRQAPEIIVPGEADHMARRLVDFFKREARADLDIACARHAATLGVRVAGLRLRDQSTRWGSCSSARTLNFNWRLVLAPPHVLDYVAAHEVAHIVEMNHAPAFWRTVERALPDYAAGKSWLKAHGHELMVIGPERAG